MSTKLASFLISIFAVFAIVITIRTFRKNRLSTRLFLMWLFIWSAIGFFALFPSLLDALMQVVNIGYRPFFLSTGAILILYVIIFYISSNVSSTNRKISKLVQEIAILNHKLENLISQNKEKGINKKK